MEVLLPSRAFSYVSRCGTLWRKIRPLFLWSVFGCLIGGGIPAFSQAGQDKGPDSTLRVDEMIRYIQQQRPRLSPRERVDLVAPFKSRSFVVATRFGNQREVLNLKGLSFRGLNLDRTSLNMASFRAAQFAHGSCRECDLVHADFTNADLTQADFSRSDLSNALFMKTNLSQTSFEGANLFHAKFEKVVGVSEEQMKTLRARTATYVELGRPQMRGRYSSSH